MLSIAKLRVGQEAYQLSGVAQSLDDYYTGAGEAAGRWVGAGAETLGLEGEVDAEDLRAVLAGLAPGSGGLTPDGATVRTHVRRVPGFDLTLKVPKSVSVLYAVSDDPRVQGSIIDAGDVAVRETIGWLEREAIRVRRGSADARYLANLAARDPDAADAARIQVRPARGVVAATFRHRTSRAGDPLLHWHTLVANMVEGPDGRWSAFVHPELYRSARAAGEVFQAALRAELTERLGLEWRRGRYVLEVAGVPEALCVQFSKRAAEIDAWLAETGTPDTPAGRQAAVLATRRGKPEMEHERFDAAWKTEAIGWGWGPVQAEVLVASAAAGTRPGSSRGDIERDPAAPGTPLAFVQGLLDCPADADAWVSELCRGLTDEDSTFSRADVVAAIAANFADGAPAGTVERVVARVFGSEQLVPLRPGTGLGGAEVGRWTSREWLDLERRFLTRAIAARDAGPAVERAVVEEVLAGLPSLGHDQERAVRVLTGTRDALSVMVGPAGTGKTFALDAVRQVFESAGYRVVGAAPSAKAAHELAADAHIASSTIHRLMGSWARGFDRPDAQTVLIVDEAGMTGLRDLDRVVGSVLDVGGRVVLVGDHRQLPEVSAGGGFAALATDPEVTVAELTVNRRQHEAWERDALAELRDGRVSDAVSALREHERVEVVEDHAAMIHAGVARWVATYEDGQVPVLLAGTNDTVDQLNTAVRRVLRDRGLLGDPVAGAGGAALGDRLTIRRNNYNARTLDGHRIAILNGHTATLTASTDAGLVVRMDHDDSEVLVSCDAITSGRLGYAYASTAHRAQGGTWDVGITVGLDGLYREAGYLVMSRGRSANWLIVTRPDLDQLDTPDLERPVELARHDSPLPLHGETPPTLDVELVERLVASRRKTLAIGHDPHAPAVHDAASTLDLATLEGWAAHARAVEAHTTRLGTADPGDTDTWLARLVHTARHITPGQRVRADDRHNIGTVTRVDDTTGTVDVAFESTAGQHATRTLAWADVHIVIPRHPEPRALDPIATATLERLTGIERSHEKRWAAQLARHGVQPDDRHVYERAARLTIDRAAAQLTAAAPEWLTELLGDRPTHHPAATQIWDDTVRKLATHRLRHAVSEPSIPTGPDHSSEPTGSTGSTLWADVAPTIAAARVWLDTHTTQPALVPTRTRSISELYGRRAALDAIFADAPDDHRHLIDQLQHGDTLPIDEPTQLLDDALAEQRDRRRWILEHWPHVVEYAQITRTLDDHLAGPEITALLATLTTSSHPRLVAAAGDAEPWIVTLAAQLVTPSIDPAVTPIDPATAQLLADVADYRQRWNVTGPAPLGEAAMDLDQADHRAVLILAINHALDTHHPDQAHFGAVERLHLFDPEVDPDIGPAVAALEDTWEG